MRGRGGRLSRHTSLPALTRARALTQRRRAREAYDLWVAVLGLRLDRLADLRLREGPPRVELALWFDLWREAVWASISERMDAEILDFICASQ